MRNFMSALLLGAAFLQGRGISKHSRPFYYNVLFSWEQKVFQLSECWLHWSGLRAALATEMRRLRPGQWWHCEGVSELWPMLHCLPGRDFVSKNTEMKWTPVREIFQHQPGGGVCPQWWPAHLQWGLARLRFLWWSRGRMLWSGPRLSGWLWQHLW